jgi:hypothetical protein
MDKFRKKIHLPLAKIQKQRFVVTTEGNMILPKDRRLIEYQVQTLYHRNIPDDLSWEWTNEEGKFTKRLAKVIDVSAYDFDYNLSTAIQTASFNLPENLIYVADLHFGEISWKDGDYGDGGSCYFNYSQASAKRRDYVERCGIGAVRLYGSKSWAYSKTKLKRVRRNKDTMCGYGRAWLIPDQPFDGAAIVHNAYPKGTRITMFAHVLAGIINNELDMKEPYDVSHVSYMKESDSPFFLNSGGCGIVAPASKMDMIPDDNWEIPNELVNL